MFLDTCILKHKQQRVPYLYAEVYAAEKTEREREN